MPIASANVTGKDVFEHRKPNQLDPGPPRRRKTQLGCKCVLASILLPLALGLGWTAYRAFNNQLKTFSDPHSFLYQNLDEAYRPQDVLRPLVDSNQTFDIVATVWLRSPKPAVPNYEMDWYHELPGWLKSQTELKLEETAIFSDTVFKGLRLRDKNIKASVNFQVPTEIFKLRELNNYDLRGSFVLIPNSPSPLDHATLYSSWIPQGAKYPPVRSWQNEPNNLTAGPSLADSIVDSYGVFTPLLAFHDIESECPGLSQEDDEEPETNDHEDDIVLPWGVAENRKKWVSTKDKPILATHPYIITRSFLRVVDMTKIMNKQAFDNQHSKIKTYSCGRLGTINGYRAEPSWKDCLHNYNVIGNQGVKVRLTYASEKMGKNRTEWAYAPYLSLAERVWGPKDLVPVPLNREVCPGGDNTLNAPQESPFVNITWNIVFSGKSPVGLSMGDAMGQAIPSHNMTDAEHAQRLQHVMTEFSQGLVGHRFRDNYHPRRELGFLVIATLFFEVAVILDILYWSARSSTAGISIRGVSILAGSNALSVVATIAFTVLQKGEFTFLAFSILISQLFSFITAGVMLKAITRSEIHLWKKVIPIVAFAPATHSERTSHRIDSRTPFRFIVVAYLALSSFLYIVQRQGYYIINPRSINGEPFKSTMCQFLYWSPHYLLRSAGILGWTLQIQLNHRMKTFAGMYKTTVYMELIAMLFDLASKSPRIVGESNGAAAWTYFDLLKLLCYLVFALQAFKYLTVSSLDEDEDTK